MINSNKLLDSVPDRLKDPPHDIFALHNGVNVPL